MTEHESPEFYERLAALGELFDAKPFSEAKARLYFDALRDLPLEAVVVGMTESAKRSKFMPRPADIRQHVEGDDETVTESAWLEYKRLARAVGSYGSPQFNDGALGRTVLAIFGSWEGACLFEATPEMWAAKRKEFARVYKTLRTRGETQPTRLLGFCERDNSERGFDKIMRRLTDDEVRLLTDGNGSTLTEH